MCGLWAVWLEQNEDNNAQQPSCQAAWGVECMQGGGILGFRRTSERVIHQKHPELARYMFSRPPILSHHIVRCDKRTL